METTREPYEFLVRWIPAGVPENQYQGTIQAQINFAYVARDGDVVVQWTPDNKGPYPVAISGENGIDLIDIFPSLNSAALIASADAQAALSQALTRIAELENAAPPQLPVALSVSRMQAILALHDADLLSSVEQIIAQADPRTQLAWNTATEFSRTSPTIAALWQALGKTSEELDALFAAAKQIEV